MISRKDRSSLERRHKPIASFLPTYMKPKLTSLPWLGKGAPLGIEVAAARLVSICES